MNNIKEFVLLKKDLIVHKENGVFLVKDDKCLLELKSFFGNINKVNEETLLIQDFMGSFQLLSKNKLSEKINGFYNIHSNGRVFFKDNNGRINKYENDLIVEYPITTNGMFFGHFLVSQSNNIDIINLKLLKTIFSFPLTTLGTWKDGAIEKNYQVREFSGIYKNTLVCTLNSGGVLLLDIEKGEVKAFFKDAKIQGGIFQKEKDSSIFIGLKHTYFIEFDAGTGQIIRHVSIQDELKRIEQEANKKGRWVTVGTSVYKNGLIYFYSETDMLCVFNPETLQIEDFYEFDFDFHSKGQQLKGGKENLQVKDNKIYCLDTLGNLYELER